MTTDKLEWCIVRLGNDFNWWVNEISDDIHWDVDNLSILDPKQVDYMLDLLRQMNQYGFKKEILENAFFKFDIDKQLPGENMIRLIRVTEDLSSCSRPLFALPNVIDDTDGPYAEFIDHIIALRVKLLNNMLTFKQPMTSEELEDAMRDEQHKKFIEGSSVHLFDEIMFILDYVPVGYSLDDDEPKEESDDEDIDLSGFDDNLPESEEFDGSFEIEE